MSMNTKTRNLVISILVGAIIIAVTIIYAGFSSSNIGPLSGTNSFQPAAVPSTADQPFIGKADAPVMLAYWRDFQCPFCHQFEENVLPALVSEYVNTGKLRIVFKDFAFLGPDSQTAATVARAVWAVAPDHFYDWQKYIYDHQGSEGSGWASRANLLSLTQAVPGIDVNKVSASLDQNAVKYQSEISADYEEGRGFGITGTPGFVIGGRSFSGAQSIAFFNQLIDAELAKQ